MDNESEIETLCLLVIRLMKNLDINVLQKLASSRLNRHYVRTRRLTRGLMTCLLKLFYYRYGSEIKTNIKLNDPIMQLFWSPYLTKIQIPPERTIDSYLLSDGTKAKFPLITQHQYI